MKYGILLLLLITVLAMISCTKNRQPASQNPDMPLSEAVDAADFALKLYKEAAEDGKNIFFSPYSINTALAMAWAGAKGNTAAQMANVLGYNLPSKEQMLLHKASQDGLNAVEKRGKAQLSIANAIFGAKRYEHLLLPEYQKSIRDYYSGELHSLDFGDATGTASFINKWVEAKTAEKIKDLISAEHIRASNDGMVLVNAIYFNGRWKKRFNPDFTMKDKFFMGSPRTNDTPTAPVMMMHIRDSFGYAEMDDCQVLELPYEEDELAMLVILPKDIKAAEAKLDTAHLKKYQQAIQAREVKVFLPRFKLDISLADLSKNLKDMGITDAFSANLADFSGIRKSSGGAGLYIMDVIHKAFIEVKEEGTEAAAATGVVMATKSAAPSMDNTPIFRADHPFLYMILHKPSNTLLFVGKYCDPPGL